MSEPVAILMDASMIMAMLTSGRLCPSLPALDSHEDDWYS